MRLHQRNLECELRPGTAVAIISDMVFNRPWLERVSFLFFRLITHKSSVAFWEDMGALKYSVKVVQSIQFSFQPPLNIQYACLYMWLFMIMFF